MLQYICRLFEAGITDKKAVYRKTLVRHARPRFILFFNGTAAFPDHKRMRLSESFEQVAGFEDASLELEIDVYNVNEGWNRSIMESCEELTALGDGRSRAEITLAAVRLAIRDCRDAGLLSDFWDKMRQEEINMLANEWDMQTALEVEREEGFEKGVETVAVNALAKGLPFELIRELTGLDTETITGLSQRAR